MTQINSLGHWELRMSFVLDWSTKMSVQQKLPKWKSMRNVALMFQWSLSNMWPHTGRWLAEIDLWSKIPAFFINLNLTKAHESTCSLYLWYMSTGSLLKVIFTHCIKRYIKIAQLIQVPFWYFVLFYLYIYA